MARAFHTKADFTASESPYSLLPFRFIRLDEERELLTTDWGEWLIAPAGTARAVVHREIAPSSELYRRLKARQMIADDYSSPLLDVAAAKLRTKKSFIEEFTNLHLFVVTLRCEHSCPYCQVSRQTTDRAAFDMPIAVADRSVDLMFQSPARNLTLEFQGGEPFLAFDTIRHVVQSARRRAGAEGRGLFPVVATNLAVVTNEMLEFCRDHGVRISTSLDGPAWLHNRNRPRPGGDSYERAVDGIERARSILGRQNVSALMTTTQASLDHPREIIDEYVRLGFGSIFLRSISPYGFATRSRRKRGYELDRFLAFYKDGLDYVLELNRRGTRMVEIFARILLTKILTPFPTRYVDLESPSGAGISAVVYNYDGSVDPSDESRMLREMGDDSLRMGTVWDSYEDIFGSEKFLELVADGTAEALPG
ncbi:MAG: His-Xaa-Ser system radical SAM maturase HxsB, partial [Myxococcales bacterium]|nr:His-Xaa-Ser system radical SAM maturase HxsB [Myxococcales bacterium]